MSTPARQLHSISLRHRSPWNREAGLASRGYGGSRTLSKLWLVRSTQRPQLAGSATAATVGRLARRGRLEAVLLISREPMSLRKLSQSANLADGTEARTLLTELRQCYDARGSAFQVEQLAGGYQLLTRPKFAPWLRPLVPIEQEIRLTPPALETLAVVAYRQPVLRSEVEAIRGVACGEILRQLMDRDLLRIVGRSEELGRPLWYGTTRRFLQLFGLCSLDELPLGGALRRTASAVDDARGTTAARSGQGATENVAEAGDSA